MIYKKLNQAFDIIISHPGFMKYFSNASWLFFEQVVRVITGLVVGVWVARYLGPEQFGLFSYVLAFIAIFAPFARLGLDKVLVRDLITDGEPHFVRLGTAFWLRVIGALLSVCLVNVTFIVFKQDQHTVMLVNIVALALIFQAFEVVAAYFQSKVQSKPIAISKLIQLAFSSVLKLYFIWVQAPLMWFVITIFLEQIVLSGALFWKYLRSNQQWFTHYFDWKLAKHYVITCWPLIISGVVLVVQSRIDHVMLKAMAGQEVLGYYSAASRLIEALGFIPTLLVSALFPAIINAKKFSTQQYQWRLYNLYRLMMILFVLIASPLYYFGENIILLMYGQAYAPSASVFSIMVLRILFINYDVARNAYLMAEDKVFYMMLSTMLGAAVNVILNLYWIPEYGGVGAVWATLISFFISTFVVDGLNSGVRGNLLTMYKSLSLVNFWK